MEKYISQIAALPVSARVERLKAEMLAEPRFVSIEQARIITRVYQQTEGESPSIRRAKALRASLEEMSIRILPEERIVGNRTPGVRGGVVFPETGASWVDREFETLPPARRIASASTKRTCARSARRSFPTGRGALSRIACAPWPAKRSTRGQGHQDQPEGSLAGAHLSEHAQVAAPRPRRPARRGGGTFEKRPGRPARLLPQHTNRHGGRAGLHAPLRRSGGKTLCRTRRGEPRRSCPRLPQTRRAAARDVSRGFAGDLVPLRHPADGGQRLLLLAGRMDQYLFPYFERSMEAGNDAFRSAGIDRMPVAEVQSGGLPAQFQQRPLLCRLPHRLQRGHRRPERRRQRPPPTP